jgi:hypothetical protein
MVSLSEAGAAFARSSTGVVSSSPIQGMDTFVYLLVCIVLCVHWSLAMNSEVLTTVYRTKKPNKRPGPTNGA